MGNKPGNSVSVRRREAMYRKGWRDAMDRLGSELEEVWSNGQISATGCEKLLHVIKSGPPSRDEAKKERSEHRRMG